MEHAAAAGISEPTTRLMNQLGLLLTAKALYAEAEPLYRRALAGDEKSYGPDHLWVARDLNNLAELLRTTNRLSEAAPLYRRAVAILAKSTRATAQQYPNFEVARSNYATALGCSEADVDAALRSVR
jgi:tetratricopeptide (TPR) repeat protein